MTLSPAARTPRRIAYVALLSCSALGTLSSTIISAPINVIAAAVDASPRGIVLAVSTYSLAMVVCCPLSGWMCQRFGSRPVLGASLALMVAAQAGAALSQDLPFLVAMRALQGVACSALPSAVQQVLGRHWADNRARVMAAWAAAIGVGQSLGPPLGGMVAATLGWRWVFVTHACLSAVLLVLCVTIVPPAPATPTSLHHRGMATLVVGIGSLVGAVSWLGQAGEPWLAAGLAAVGAIALWAHSQLGRTSAGPFIPSGIVRERRYVASTAAAGTAMACLAVPIVATPLHLGRNLGLGPGRIGVVMLALALAMTLAAPASSRVSERFSSRRTMRGGLVLLACGLLSLPWVAATTSGTLGVALTVLALALTGSAIGVTAATSGHGLMTSPAARHGVALGLHNMLRFAGMAVGYSWVAITWPTGQLVLVYGAPVAFVAASWALARPTTAPAPHAPVPR